MYADLTICVDVLHQHMLIFTGYRWSFLLSPAPLEATLHHHQYFLLLLCISVQGAVHFCPAAVLFYAK
jgi:hypothetical protein